MIEINKAALLKAFLYANKYSHPYVFVVIQAEGIKECIVIPSESFEAKEKFYMNAYNDDLVHVMNKNVKVTEVGFGNQEHLANFI